MPIIDYITQTPFKCECGEMEDLSVAEFVFGSRVFCNVCGQDVTIYAGSALS